MSFAPLILMLAALPVFYFFLLNLQERSKPFYFFGSLAGLWGVFGIFFAMIGVVGFSYFIIYIILLIFGIISQVFFSTLFKIYRKKARRLARELPPLRKFDNITTGILVIFVVIILYIGFFAVSVNPARAATTTYFTEEEEVVKSLPYTYRIDYKYGWAYVVVLTIRTIPLTTSFYSDKLKDAKSDIVEHIENEGGNGGEIEDVGETEEKINGHDAVVREYNIEWKVKKSGYWGGSETETYSGKLYLKAWFCNKEFATIVVGVIYPTSPVNLREKTMAVADSVECH